MTKVKTSGKKRYHHGNLKKALTDAAVDIIKQYGKNGLTLRAVAQAAQVSRTAPYRHFKNKEAILAAVAEEGFRELAIRLDSIAAEETDVLERIFRQAHAYVSYARDNPARFAVMFGFNLQSYLLYPSLQRTATAAVMCLFQSVEACQEAGIVKTGDQIEIAFGAWMPIHGFAVLLINGLVPFTIDSEEDLARLVRDYSLSYLEGMSQR